jgi:hypothetical protein
MCLDYFFSKNHFQMALNTSSPKLEALSFRHLENFVGMLGGRAKLLDQGRLRIFFSSAFCTTTLTFDRLVDSFGPLFANGLNRQALTIWTLERPLHTTFVAIIEHLLSLAKQSSVAKCERMRRNVTGIGLGARARAGLKMKFECKAEIEEAVRCLMLCKRQERSFFLDTKTLRVLCYHDYHSWVPVPGRHFMSQEVSGCPESCC